MIEFGDKLKSLPVHWTVEISASDPDDKDEKKLWQVNPSIFELRGKFARLERILDLLKPLARFGLFILLVAYPIAIVVVGIVYGGLVFWSTLAGSVVLIWLLLSKLGYASNFEGSQPNLARQLFAVTLAFLGVLGFYLGIIYLRVWFLPVPFVLGGILLLLFLRR